MVKVRYIFIFNNKGQRDAFNTRLANAGRKRFKNGSFTYCGEGIKHPTENFWASECEPILDELGEPIEDFNDERVKDTIWELLLIDLNPSDVKNLKPMDSTWISVITI